MPASIPRSYYLDLGHKDVRTGMYDAFDFDAEGIPRYPYDGHLHYNITFICHYALYRLDRYHKYRLPEDLACFLRVGAWVAEHGVEDGASFTFPYRFRWGALRPPWISALGQGRMISVLTRVYEATGTKRFLDLARKAATPFEISVNEGGVRRPFPDGGVAFEEYPLPHRNLVLNGLLTALFGLYDLAEIGEDASASRLFTAATDALERNLARYDLGYWSTYDLTGPVRRVAGDGYHAYHIMQLWALYEMTGRTAFRTWAAQWERYRKGPRLYLFRNLSRIYTRVQSARNDRT